MLIAISKYLKSIDQVNQHRSDHIKFLKPLFKKGKLLICGRQSSEKGGVIVSHSIQSKTEFAAILEEDPYVLAGVAKYEILEFTPALHAELLSPLFSKKHCHH